MRHYILILAVFILNGCEDRTRYYCQQYEHFKDEQCQHPRCDFSQTCPEYLVAPILEKKIEGNPAQTPVQQQCQANCR
jgi:hypothetical protein